MRSNLGFAIRTALEVELPPVPLHAIRARAASRANTLHERRPSSAAVIAAMVLIGTLLFFMAGRMFVAPAPVTAGAHAPAPSPTMT